MKNSRFLKLVAALCGLATCVIIVADFVRDHPIDRLVNTMIKLQQIRPRNFSPSQAGYTLSDDLNTVTFVYDPSLYPGSLHKGEKLFVVGTFNNWKQGDEWEMKPADGKKEYILVRQLKDLQKSPGETVEFKFVTSTGRWQELDRIDAEYKKGRNLFLNLNRFRHLSGEAGYEFVDGMKSIRFIYQPSYYDAKLWSPTDTVYLVGTFNNWGEAAGDPAWRMSREKAQKTYVMVTNSTAVNVPGISGYPEFKFITGAGVWQEVTNIDPSYKKNNNLWIDFDMYADITPPRPIEARLINNNTVIVTFTEQLHLDEVSKTSHYSLSGGSVVSAVIHADGTQVKLTITPIDFKRRNYQVDETLTISDIPDASDIIMKKPVTLPLTVDRDLLEDFFQNIPISDKQFGFSLIGKTAWFRLFGPRLQKAAVLLFRQADDTVPYLVLPMKPDSGFVWEAATAASNVTHGTFYRFKIERAGKQSIISDPYARANLHSRGKSIVILPGVNEHPFTGWTDNGYTTPPRDELVIYETHLANLTGLNPVVSNLAHMYVAMTNDMPGSPLNYLARLGINAVEFLPLHEFQNRSGLDFRKQYHWGYMTSLFFAPESSYSSDPVARRQVSEFKSMVDALHRKGIAVIVDVVYNHTSNVDNYLSQIDPDYYFTGGNLSGCGNDTYCLRPMMRKLILDSLCHWVMEYHIDGFRFDLSHLCAQEGLFTEENIKKIQECKATKGDVILIAENWASDRSTIKGSGVAQWNDWFREDIKAYVTDGSRRESIPKRVRWSFDRRAYAGPMECVNYFESHDEETLANKMTHAGIISRNEQLKRARMAALLLLTSEGIPMLWEGQEMLRNRPRQLQDYRNNMLDWSLTVTNSSIVEFYRRLIELRKQYPVLRPAEDQGNGFIQLLNTPNEKALGYVLNFNKKMKDQPRFVVLLNPDNRNATFRMPPGKWKLLTSEKGFMRKPIGMIPTAGVPASSGLLIMEEAEIP